MRQADSPEKAGSPVPRNQSSLTIEQPIGVGGGKGMTRECQAMRKCRHTKAMTLSSHEVSVTSQASKTLQ